MKEHIIALAMYVASMRALDDMANVWGCRIAERRDAVVGRRQKLKTASAARAKKLHDSLAWQNFRRDANEVCVHYV